MSPKDHEFNWVSALDECSVRAEFVALRRDSRKNVEIRNEQRRSFQEHSQTPLFERGFYPEDKPEDKFCVRRHDRSGGRGCFSNKEDHILVEWIGTKGEDIKNPISITPTLDDEGKCCYRINGKGLRLRWQVLLMAPENLLFEGLT